MARSKIPKDKETTVLLSSRRRCAICYGLNRDVAVKKGQIAHLDKDNSNNALTNLAFLCFDHHDQYDSKTSQSKNFTMQEVIAYRSELYEGLVTGIHVQSALQKDLFKPSPEQSELQSAIVELLESKLGPKSLQQLVYSLRVSIENVELALLGLVDQNVVRKDRMPGSVKIKYSLTSFLENQILDAFIKTLDVSIIKEVRFLSKGRAELDCLLETKTANLAIEVIVARESLSLSRINRSIKMLDSAISILRLDSCKQVLLVGITADTDTSAVDIKQYEKKGILVKFLELETEEVHRFYQRLKGFLA